ncbi:hypothetical protein FFLO_05864 [Filobasidium floriforme]|uniref:Uncharacterized protein n=1 Tax=Filobasidium floriforme TaxID=5210 RepID=A0A8K0JG31_9TREE|nr:uncharacterized protein HD553DRAFT_325234 [Filobasidium floriforme]KAG7528965.1 hypothetical protein FFLO_05864 [Filobasidium floriforme]KAH8081751.1 hypothetical protein HD553DRAFT_325234 [Filobasidium floriforme]
MSTAKSISVADPSVQTQAPSLSRSSAFGNETVPRHFWFSENKEVKIDADGSFSVVYHEGDSECTLMTVEKQGDERVVKTPHSKKDAMLVLGRTGGELDMPVKAIEHLHDAGKAIKRGVRRDIREAPAASSFWNRYKQASEKKVKTDEELRTRSILKPNSNQPTYSRFRSTIMASEKADALTLDVSESSFGDTRWADKQTLDNEASTQDHLKFRFEGTDESIALSFRPGSVRVKSTFTEYVTQRLLGEASDMTDEQRVKAQQAKLVLDKELQQRQCKTVIERFRGLAAKDELNSGERRIFEVIERGNFNINSDDANRLAQAIDRCHIVTNRRNLKLLVQMVQNEKAQGKTA